MLKEDYNRPYLLHEAHTCAIVEVPSMKDGNAKKLHRLHDLLIQHLQALKVMDYMYDPSPIITSLRQVKVDRATTFAWQRDILSTSKVSHHNELLKFLDLKTQASKSTIGEGTCIKCSAQSMPHEENVLQKSAYFAN